MKKKELSGTKQIWLNQINKSFQLEYSVVVLKK